MQQYYGAEERKKKEGMPEDPRGPPLTLTIKEQTISVKHVFSAFTLYANVLRRVKVPFDEAQQEFITGAIHCNLPKRNLQTSESQACQDGKKKSTLS